MLFSIFRRKMGKFRPTDPKSPEVDKGYKLRDTDDRLHRMKAQAAKHRSQEAVIMNGYCNNGKLRARLMNSQEAVIINGYCNYGKLRARLILKKQSLLMAIVIMVR